MLMEKIDRLKAFNSKGYRSVGSWYFTRVFSSDFFNKESKTSEALSQVHQLC